MGRGLRRLYTCHMVHCGQWRILLYTTTRLWALHIGSSFYLLSHCCVSWVVASLSANYHTTVGRWAVVTPSAPRKGSVDPSTHSCTAMGNGQW